CRTFLLGAGSDLVPRPCPRECRPIWSSDGQVAIGIEHVTVVVSMASPVVIRAQQHEFVDGGATTFLEGRFMMWNTAIDVPVTSGMHARTVSDLQNSALCCVGKAVGRDGTDRMEAPLDAVEAEHRGELTVDEIIEGFEPCECGAVICFARTEPTVPDVVTCDAEEGSEVDDTDRRRPRPTELGLGLDSAAHEAH